MAINLGNAVGYLDLDISKFEVGISSALGAIKGLVTGTGTVSSNITKLGNVISSAGSSLTKNITLPTTAAGAAIVATSAKFESGMSKISAISGATGKDLELIKSKAMEMGAKTKFSASEAADAFSYMAMAGWKTSDMLDGIEGIMNLAAASGEDLASVSDIVTDALTAFGLTAKDSGHFVDVLAKASNDSNTDVSMLGESFKYVAPLCGAMGYSAEDCAIALGLMANAGIKGSQSGTTLKSALANLASPTKEMQKVMSQYNLSLTNSDGSMKSLSEVMVMLRSNLGGLDEQTKAAAASTLFGKEAMSGMLSIINASDEDFNKLTESIYNCDGTAQSMAETMNDNLSGQITILKSTLETLALQLGEIIVPYVKSLIEGVQKFTTWLTSLNEEQKRTVVKIAAVAAAIGPLILVFGKLMAGVGTAISIVGKVKDAFGLLKLVIGGISSPVMLVVAALAALVAGLGYVFATNENVRNSFKDMVSNLMNSLKPALDVLTETVIPTLVNLFKDFAENIMPVVIQVFTALWEEAIIPLGNFIAETLAPRIQVLMDAFTVLWQNVLAPLADFFMSIFIAQIEGFANIITNVVLPVIGFFIDALNGLWQNVLQPIVDFFISTFGPTVQNIFESVGEKINAFKEILVGIIEFITGVLSLDWKQAWEGIKDIFKGIWDLLVSNVKSFMDMIYNAIDTALGLIGIDFDSVWNGIKNFISNILSTIKSIVEKVWNGIKEFISVVLGVIYVIFKTQFDIIKGFIELVLNAIKKLFETIWNAIGDKVKTVVNTIKNIISTVFNTIKNVISTILNAIKSTVSNIFDSIKNTISNIINGIKSTVTSVWNAIKSAIVNPINDAKNTVVGIFESIKSSISDKINGAKNAVSSAIDAIKGFFNFQWSLPSIKLPHFKVSGSANPIDWIKDGVPNFSVEWYAKGGVFDKASLIGVGEDGAEAVVPLEKNLGWIKNLVEQLTSKMSEMLKNNNLIINMRDALLNVSNQTSGLTKSIDILNDTVDKKSTEENKTSDSVNTNKNGGDTYNFYSQAKLSEVECAKEMKKMKQQLAGGF